MVLRYSIAIAWAARAGRKAVPIMTTLVIAEPTAPADKGLRAGALGLVSSVVIAVSSTAPAYSMAATLGLIMAIVGVHSPGTLVVSFLPMLCIA